MSIEQLGSKSYALRNLWEATLFDEKGNSLDWTTGQMVSTNIPKLKFIVEPILAGSSKGYMGWDLPDNLSLTMLETSDHTLEKYLDEWMMGESGVFNPKTGAFRVQKSAGSLYRNVKIRTFYYKFTSGEDINVKIHEAIKREAEDYIIQVSNETKKLTGQPLSTESQGHLQKQTYTLMAQEYIKANSIPFVEQKQVIPIVDKLTALVSSVANQAVSKIPLSNLTRAIIPPLVIPPPLLRIPVATGVLPPIPRHLEIPIHFGNLSPKSVDIRKVSLPALQQDIALQDRTKKSVQDLTEKIVAITGGDAINAKKKWKTEEVTTALVTYTCAIESYDIGTYDYQTGGGVQYTINLPVCDIKIEHDF
jgi:hypothetical protein